MAIAPIPWNVNRKTLAEFSEVSMVVFGMIAAPLALWRGSSSWAIAFWAVAVAFRVVGLVWPEGLKPVYLGMILLGWPIGWTVANSLLLVVYLGLFMPLGFLLRLRRGDLLGRRFDRSARSYWVPTQSRTRPQDYLRQF